jgi:hypothetical protein
MYIYLYCLVYKFIITYDYDKIHQDKIHVYNYEGILQQLSVYTIEEGFH